MANSLLDEAQLAYARHATMGHLVWTTSQLSHTSHGTTPATVAGCSTSPASPISRSDLSLMETACVCRVLLMILIQTKTNTRRAPCRPQSRIRPRHFSACRHRQQGSTSYAMNKASIISPVAFVARTRRLPIGTVAVGGIAHASYVISLDQSI